MFVALKSPVHQVTVAIDWMSEQAGEIILRPSKFELVLLIFGLLTLLGMVFYYSATENTSNSMVFCCVAKLCRESRPFLVQFYVANHAVLVAHFNPKKSGG